MRCRKNYRDLTEVERDRFVQALYYLKSTGLVDQFANEHATFFHTGIHGTAHFLPWHRDFLRRFEDALRTFHPDIAIPYWNSTVDTSPSDPLWDNAFLGQFDAAWGLGRALGSDTLPTPQQVQDAPQVTLDAAVINFLDVPEGETRLGAAVFSLNACEPVHFTVVSSPTVTSGPPATTFGVLASPITADPDVDPKGRLWLTYQGTSAGDMATGTVTIRCDETGEEFPVDLTANTIARPAAHATANGIVNLLPADMKIGRRVHA
jgi:hypothetical protein